MRLRVRSEFWFFLTILVCIFMAAAISEWDGALGFLLFLIGAPIVICAFVVGVLVFVWHGLKGALPPLALTARLRTVAAVPALAAITVLLAPASCAAGHRAGMWSHFLAHRTRYDHIVAKIQRSAPPNATRWRTDESGVEYLADVGPPVRIAFDADGLIDNWTGIIFDPTGEVMFARGFDPVTGEFFAPERITKLFGGDLVGCRPLTGSYYYCSFT